MRFSSFVRAFAIARKVSMLPRRRVGEFNVYSFDSKSVVLEDNAESRSAGFVSLYLSNNLGHFVLKPGFKQVAEVADGIKRIERGVHKVISFPSRASKTKQFRGWVSGWLADKPADLQLNCTEVLIRNGKLLLPAWLQLSGDHWVIHVHGRTAKRAETLRTFALLENHGYTNLAISLRNNSEGSDFAHRRSHFGSLEWLDVEAAIRFALENGAKKITLFGISQGAVSVAEFLRNSINFDCVSSVVLDSPVVSWPPVIEHQLKLAGENPKLSSDILRIFRSALYSQLLRLKTPVNLTELGFSNWSSRFEIPLLILASREDGYLPFEPIESLAREHNERVTLKIVAGAGHVRLFNSDPKTYETEVTRFLSLSKR